MTDLSFVCFVVFCYLVWQNVHLMKKYQALLEVHTYQTKQFARQTQPSQDDGTGSDHGQMSNRSNLSLVLYYASWCGHSRTFMPIWSKLKQKYANDSRISIKTYQCDGADKGVCDASQLEGYPTIRLLQGNQLIKEYEGMRTIDGLVNFIEKLFR